MSELVSWSGSISVKRNRVNMWNYFSTNLCAISLWNSIRQKGSATRLKFHVQQIHQKKISNFSNNFHRWIWNKASKKCNLVPHSSSLPTGQRKKCLFLTFWLSLQNSQDIQMPICETEISEHRSISHIFWRGDEENGGIVVCRDILDGLGWMACFCALWFSGLLWACVVWCSDRIVINWKPCKNDSFPSVLFQLQDYLSLSLHA